MTQKKPWKKANIWFQSINQSINQSIYLTWSVRLAKKLVYRYTTKEKENRDYKSLLKVYKLK